MFSNRPEETEEEFETYTVEYWSLTVRFLYPGRYDSTAGWTSYDQDQAETWASEIRSRMGETGPDAIYKFQVGDKLVETLDCSKIKMMSLKQESEDRERATGRRVLRRRGRRI